MTRTAIWLASLLAAALTLACGGDGNKTIEDGDRLAGQNGGQSGGPEVTVPGPASRYVTAESEAPPQSEVRPPDTFGLPIESLAATGPFESPEKGVELLKKWGYADGFQTAIQPNGLLAATLQGAFYINTEAYLFSNLTGARDAFEYFADQSNRTGGSQNLDVPGTGNEWAAWKLVKGTIGTSPTVAVYYRFLFRRGTLVVSVQIYGADTHLSIDQARSLAGSIDARALGNRPAPTPTPIEAPNLLPVVTPAGTATATR